MVWHVEHEMRKGEVRRLIFRGLYSFNHDGILYPPLTEINEMLQGFLLILFNISFLMEF